MNSTSADALLTSSTSAMGTSGAGAFANALLDKNWVDSATTAAPAAAKRAFFVIRRSPDSRFPGGLLA
jgi:hypothetical protein